VLNFSVCLLLGIAYGASIGGMGTLIGTPPNALLAGFLSETYGVEVGFFRWMLVGVPLVVVALPLCWLLLTKLYPIRLREIPGGEAIFAREAASLGPMTRAEIQVAATTISVALAWVFQSPLEQIVPGISDAGIAMMGALLLFAVPVDWRRMRFALTWADAERLPWGVLILFGGGLSLAGAIQGTGLAAWIGQALAGISAWPIALITLTVTAVIVFLTELTSNTATAAAFLPVVAALATGIGQDPMLLAIPTVLAASCAFMLPVATPPNAIVFATGHLTIPQMARAGLWLNVLFIVLINAALYALAVPLFGIR
jgi:sodium-dependent dicarboxylate transporter 2/3/5